VAKGGSFELLGSSDFTGTGTTKRIGELGELILSLSHDLIVVLAKNFVKRTLSMRNLAPQNRHSQQLAFF
jgi:hypothetical protein